MKILFLHQYYLPPGGFGNDRSRQICAFWADAGAQVEVLTSTAYFPDNWKNTIPHKEIGKGIFQFQDAKVKVFVLDVPYSHYWGFTLRVMAFLRFFFQGMKALKYVSKPDVIYASSTPPTVGELGRRAAKQFQVPFIFETVDVWPDVPQGMGILKNPILLAGLNARVNRIYREAAHIVCLSPGMQQQVLSHSVDATKVSVSYNGTNTNTFKPAENPEAKKQKVVAVYTGTVGIANDLCQLIEAAKLLESESEIEFRILGSGNDLDRVKRHVKYLQCGNVKFFDPLPKEKVAAFFEDADIGIVSFAPFPVLEANSANKFYDYLSCGIPIVINYRGWQAEALKNSEAGLSSVQGDVQAFAANIRMLANDPTKRKRMGQNARMLACAEYDRKILAAKLLSLLEKISSKN